MITVLIGLWGAWFLLAKVSLYENSQTFQVDRNGSLIATFPAESLGRVRLGQKATLYLDGAGEERPRQLKAEVMDVTTRPQNGQGQVRLYVYSPVRLSEEGQGQGQVRIEVEGVSPAILLMRTAGQRLGSSQLSAGLSGLGKQGAQQ